MDVSSSFLLVEPLNDKIVFIPAFLPPRMSVYNLSPIIAILFIGNSLPSDNAYFERSGKKGFINKKGFIVVKPIYDNVGSFSEGLARVKLNGKWGFIDKKGNVVIKPEYVTAISFNNGLALVLLNGGDWGYIDYKGNLVWKSDNR